MKALVVFAILLACMQLVYLQQCRQITVCDEDSMNTGGGKGAKGDVGAPGKSGPVGMKGSNGSKGDVGEKGIQGESCALGSFESEIRNKFRAQGLSLEKLTEVLQNISNRFQEIDDKIASVQQQGVNISEDVNNRFQAIDDKMATVQQQGVNISEKLTSFLTLSSCANSLVNGRQILQSGEEVFCESGWTVFQKHKGNNLKFDKTWSEFKQGFGSFSGDFWLGLDNIHQLTTPNGSCRLRVDVWDSNDQHTYAEYSNFYVDDENANYTLHVSGYTGTAGDGLNEHSSKYQIHNNMQFSTKDKDNDNNSGNCASAYRGEGWWYNACYDSILNFPHGGLKWNSQTKKSSTMGI